MSRGVGLWACIGETQTVLEGARPSRDSENWRNIYNSTHVIGKHGSANWGKVASCLGLADLWNVDRQGEHRAVLNAWGEYCEVFTWQAQELGSRHIYGDWDYCGIEAAWAHAVAVGRERLADELALHIRTGLTLMALGAGPVHDSGAFPGPRTTMTGSRSFICTERKEDGKTYRWDENGNPMPIFHIYDQPLDFRLGRHLRLQGASNQHRLWLDEHWQAYRQELGVDMRDLLSRDERSVLLRLLEGDVDAVPAAIGYLEEGPTVIEPLRVRATRDGRLTMIEDGVSPGSTPMMYAMAWYKRNLPDGPHRAMPWFRASEGVAWLGVDNPMQRTHGRDGRAKLEDGAIIAQRKQAQDYFDEEKRSHFPGWKSLPIPGGEVMWDIRLSKNKGVQRLDDGSGPVDPPVDPPIDPNPKPGYRYLEKAEDQIMRAKRRWGKPRGIHHAQRAIGHLETAIGRS